MNDIPSFKKTFTVEQANRMLPLVRRICEDVVETYQHLVDQYQRYQAAAPADEENLDAPHLEELESMHQAIDADKQRIGELARELDDLGVLLKGEANGLVDFPSLMDGRVVFLCWKLGEPEVAHWHEIEAGFSGRQPLLTSVAADFTPPSLENDEPGSAG